MIEKFIAPVTNLLDKFIADADTKQKIAHEIATMSERHAQEIALAQIAVNKAEAGGNHAVSASTPVDAAAISITSFVSSTMILLVS